MSRSIQWYILFPKQQVLRHDQLEMLAQQILDADFQLVNPRSGQIMLLGGDGEGYVPSLDQAGAFQYISTHTTSLLSLWRGDLAISLEFDPSGAGLIDQAEGLGLDDDSYFGSIVVHLDRTYLREPTQAMSVLESVEQLFWRLCRHLNAPFGFALDEWTVEAMARDWHVQRQVATHAIPSLRFPVSYYSVSYFPTFSSEAFERLGYKCTQIDSTGYLVTNLEELAE